MTGPGTDSLIARLRASDGLTAFIASDGDPGIRADTDLLVEAADRIEALERAQSDLIDVCGLALNYHQEDHVYDALRAAFLRAVDAK